MKTTGKSLRAFTEDTSAGSFRQTLSSSSPGWLAGIWSRSRPRPSCRRPGQAMRNRRRQDCPRSRTIPSRGAGPGLPQGVMKGFARNLPNGRDRPREPDRNPVPIRETPESCPALQQIGHGAPAPMVGLTSPASRGSREFAAVRRISAGAPVRVQSDEPCRDGGWLRASARGPRSPGPTNGAGSSARPETRPHVVPANRSVWRKRGESSSQSTMEACRLNTSGSHAELPPYSADADELR